MTYLYTPALSASEQADRLERAAQNEELAEMIALKLVQAQRGAAAADAAAATAPIRRADFDKLTPQAAMAAIKAGRRVID